MFNFGSQVKELVWINSIWKVEESFTFDWSKLGIGTRGEHVGGDWGHFGLNIEPNKSLKNEQ